MLKPSLLACALIGAALQASPAAAAPKYLGQVRCGTFDYDTRDYVRMEGQLLPIRQNLALFSLLGTTFGGDGRTTFALPDTRGRVIVGAGDGPDGRRYQVGERGGSSTFSIATYNMPAHSHMAAPLASGADATSVSPENKVAATKARTTLYAEAADLVPMAPTVTSAVGGAQPVPMPSPTLGMACYILVNGQFPPRQ